MSLITPIPNNERKGDVAVLSAINALLDVLKRSKPNDHSGRDRWYAICITDAEKLDAIFRSQVIARREEENATTRIAQKTNPCP